MREGPTDSPRFVYRSSSAPIHDHEFQDAGDQQRPGQDAESEEDDFSRSLRTSSVPQQIEELTKFTASALTRLETLERELKQLRGELAEKDKQTYWGFLALSVISVPCCLFVLWSLTRRSR